MRFVLPFIMGLARREQKAHQYLVPCVYWKPSFILKFWDWKVLQCICRVADHIQAMIWYSQKCLRWERLGAKYVAVGCYIQHVLCIVFCESSNAGFIMEETSYKYHMMICKVFLTKKSASPKFLTWHVLWEVLKTSMKIMLKKCYKVVHWTARIVPSCCETKAKTRGLGRTRRRN